MTKEQKFYQQVQSHLPRSAHCCRIENAIESGMPDVSVCLGGHEVWIELKCYEKGRVLIRPAQNAWCHRRAAAGGHVMIVALHPIGNVHVWIFPHIEVSPHDKYLCVGTNHCHDVVEWEHLNRLIFY